MRAVIQRVRHACVSVKAEEVGRIGRGALVLVGFGAGDLPGSPAIERLADRLVKLRMFDDAKGRMNLSLVDVGGAVLLVSQITLVARLGKGQRPGFDAAAQPAVAEQLFQALLGALSVRGVQVQTGRFGAEMVVALENDGPVTFVMEESGGLNGGT